MLNLQEHLIKFILASQDDETGGFADRPGDMVSKSKRRTGSYLLLND